MCARGRHGRRAGGAVSALHALARTHERVGEGSSTGTGSSTARAREAATATGRGNVRCLPNNARPSPTGRRNPMRDTRRVVNVRPLLGVGLDAPTTHHPCMDSCLALSTGSAIISPPLMMVHRIILSRKGRLPGQTPQPSNVLSGTAGRDLAFVY
jgi:hypothetical protein